MRDFIDRPPGEPPPGSSATVPRGCDTWPVTLLTAINSSQSFFIQRAHPRGISVKMVNFDFATANATQLMNEIIRITLTEYNALGEKIANPVPKEDEQEMVDEVMETYLDNERILDVYFARLKYLLKKSPPGRQELEIKQRQIEELIRQNGLE